MVEDVKGEKPRSKQNKPCEEEDWNQYLKVIGDKRIIIQERAIELLEAQRKRLQNRVEN